MLQTNLPSQLTYTFLSPLDFYTWTRDSALVIKALIDRFIAPGGYDANMQTIIQSYIASQAEVQAEESSCGPLFNGDGLGEPRFKVNLVHERDDWSKTKHNNNSCTSIPDEISLNDNES